MPMPEGLCSRPLPRLLWVGLLALAGCAEVTPECLRSVSCPAGDARHDEHRLRSPVPARRSSNARKATRCSSSTIGRPRSSKSPLAARRAVSPWCITAAAPRSRLEQDRVIDIRYESEPRFVSGRRPLRRNLPVLCQPVVRTIIPQRSRPYDAFYFLRRTTADDRACGRFPLRGWLPGAWYPTPMHWKNTVGPCPKWTRGRKMATMKMNL